MKTSMRRNVALMVGVGVAGVAIAGVAATGIAATAAVALGRRLRRGGRVDGKVVVITGGSRGLGFALAERFARAGARLVLASRRPEELAEARARLVARGCVGSAEDVLLVAADLTDAAQAAGLIERAIEHFGRVDVLINNAGIIEVGPFLDQPVEAFTRAMDTHYYAALHTVRAVLPGMLARAARRPGRGERWEPSAIVNIASVGGKVAVPHMLPYTASKFALVGFSEGLHAELRHKGVRVTTVCPGLLRSGGEIHARFVGQIAKEERWFNVAAKTPVIAASVRRAADKIYDSVVAGRAEITISPQAWLAVRVAGMAPETTQWVASLANEFVLPEGLVGGLPAAIPARFSQSE